MPCKVSAAMPLGNKNPTEAGLFFDGTPPLLGESARLVITLRVRLLPAQIWAKTPLSP